MDLFKKLPFTLFLLLTLSSCLGGGEEAPSEPSEPVVGSVFEPVDPAQIGQCYQDSYPGVPVENQIPPELDIVVVSYGAVNLKPHRDRLANNLNHLIESLHPDIDYRVGVIQGLGSHSSRSGKLYRRHSEPYVLRSDSLTTSEIQSYVKSKLNPHALEVVIESIFGAGSMGMVSLYKALTDNKAEIQSQGLLREDASLLVLFVSDQADVCAVYPEGVTTRNKRYREHPHSSRAQAYENDCFPGGDFLSAQRLVEQMQGATNGSLSVGGVFYNNAATTPTAAWKEFGYGYNDVILAANGISHDLASSNYAEALSKIGTHASATVVQDELFNLNAQNILPGTIEVSVDGELNPFFYYPELAQVQLVEPRMSDSDVVISYCDRKLLDQRENLQVETGGNHTCALHRDGSVRCWGQNTFGQLGQGTSENLGDNEAISTIAPLVFDEKVVQLAGGGFHTCALFESGNVRCWGRNDFGQLGYGDSLHRGIDETAPSLPFVDIGTQALAVYAGTIHTCAITSEREIKCWGGNANGELGLGTTAPIGLTNTPADFTAIQFEKDISKLDLSSISSHTCALFTDGSQKCWGRNANGQLGLGNTSNMGDDETMDQIPYTSVDNSQGGTFIATGNGHTCTLLEGQDMKCWGVNNVGQLGQPGIADIGVSDLPSDHGVVNIGISVIGVATGNLSTCALTSARQVRCWGDNRQGQAGVKEPTFVGVDSQISEIQDIDLSGLEVEAIAGGNGHHCALSKDDGRIICWGDNRQGQLGYGDAISSNLSTFETPGARGFLNFSPASE